eukprot:c9830_g1_i1.p1 GENE.c9830_g1_i1~~c9830_g1_i1.p1  ORF type:complete len:409 (+),score=95.35 c9830_g1_i1:42-1268(+)
MNVGVCLLAFGFLIGFGETQEFQGSVTCSHITSSSMVVNFEPVHSPPADLFMVALHQAPNTYRPFAFWTTAEKSVVIEDLIPETTYYIRIVAHNASAPSIVWYWFNATNEVSCSTISANRLCSATLRPLSSTSKSFSVSMDNTLPNNQLSILWRSAGMHEPLVSDTTTETTSWTTIAVRLAQTNVTVSRLPSNSYFHVKLRCYDNLTKTLSESDIIRVRTQMPGTIHTVMQRISEYTEQIDFLDNHDSSSSAALAAFITNTLGDNDFIALTSPITEYCIQHVDPDSVGGWADYTSCNGPEADPYNKPQDPMCICDVYADRLIANQNIEEFTLHCANTTWTNDTHDDPPCFCTRGNVTSKWVVSEKSDTFVGAMPVFLPYFYYELPRDTYPDTCWSALQHAQTHIVQGA